MNPRVDVVHEDADAQKTVAACIPDGKLQLLLGVVRHALRKLADLLNLHLAETRLNQQADALEEWSHVLNVEIRRGLLRLFVVVLWFCSVVMCVCVAPTKVSAPSLPRSSLRDRAIHRVRVLLARVHLTDSHRSPEPSDRW